VPERRTPSEERIVFPERYDICDRRYREWTRNLFKPFDENSPPRLVTSEFWSELTVNINPRVPESLSRLGSIEERINAKAGLSAADRNAEREEIIREVLGGDPLANIENEPARNRVRAATTDLLIALQREDEGADMFEASLAPRAWHYVKDGVLRKLYGDIKIKHLETEKEGKLASVSPLELAYVIDLLSH